jgi:tetratricopeptide (TPR) repeat protein
VLLRNIIVSFVLASSLLSEALADDRCSVDVFEADAKQAAENCTSVLNGSKLAPAVRAEALKIRARAFHSMDRLDDAIRDYEEALLFAPDDPELHVRRGWTAYDKRDLDTVFAEAHRALEIKPDYAEPYGLIGNALSLGGFKNFAVAKAAYDQAIRLQPNEPLHRWNRLVLLEDNQFYDEALEDSDAFLRLPDSIITKPSATKSYLRPTTYRIAISIERARLLRMVGRHKEAAQAYDQAVEIDPDALTYAARAEFKFTQTIFYPGAPPPPMTAVQEDLDKALALDPDFWFTRNVQARVHLSRGEYDLALPDFVRGLKAYPIVGTIRWNYATTLRSLGRNDEATEEAVKAFELDPGFMNTKLLSLQERGYLAPVAADVDPGPTLLDAVHACMLDEPCP